MADPTRTQFAMRALTLADVFNAYMANKTIGQTVKLKTELTAPEGPSTGGGKQAVQAIKLTPEGGGPAWVIGTINSVEKSAELRTFDFVQWMQSRRFKNSPLPIDGVEYEHLLQTLQAFCAQQGLRVSFEKAPADAAATSEPKPEARAPAFSQKALVVALIAAGTVILVLVALLLTRS